MAYSVLSSFVLIIFSNLIYLQVHVAVMQVSDTADILVNFNQFRDRAQIDTVIDRMQLTNGQTNLAGAFEDAYNRVSKDCITKNS